MIATGHINYLHLYLLNVNKIKYSFYFLDVLATFQVLDGHIRLVATVLEERKRTFSSSQKILLNSTGLDV